MKRLRWTPFVLALLCAPFALAWPPSPRGYVTDDAGVLDPNTVSQMVALLTNLEQTTSAQVAVVTVPSLEGRSVEEAAADVLKTWGVGQKDKNNGVVFLIAPNERKMRIEVGYGLEPTLPDGMTGRILDESVLPSLREGRMAEGVWNGTQRIAAVLGGQERAAPRPKGPPQWTFFLFLLILVLLFGRHPFSLWYLLFARPRWRGPRGGGGGWGGGGFGGGGFGGFGGGMSGGGGASRGW